MFPMIKRNTTISVLKQRCFVTTCNCQTDISFPILQGERLLSEDNFEIGEFTIREVPPRRAGQEGAIVTFSIDINGILTAAAVRESDPNS